MYKAMSAWVYNGLAFVIMILVVAVVHHVIGRSSLHVYAGALLVSVLPAVVIGDILYTLLASRTGSKLVLLSDSTGGYEWRPSRVFSRSRTFVRSGKGQALSALIASISSAVLMAVSLSNVISGREVLGVAIEIVGVSIGGVVWYLFERLRKQRRERQ